MKLPMRLRCWLASRAVRLGPGQPSLFTDVVTYPVYARRNLYVYERGSLIGTLSGAGNHWSFTGGFSAGIISYGFTGTLLDGVRHAEATLLQYDQQYRSPEFR